MGTQTNIRQSNLELLRILCILAIISEHFSWQSEISNYMTGGILSQGFMIIISSLSRVGCDIFVIIGAWFLCEQKFKLFRCVHIWLTIISYTVSMTLICKFILGIPVDFAQFIQAFFPIEKSPLWFASYYIVLLFVSPLLNNALKNLSRNHIKLVLVLYFIGSCVYKTITNDKGFFSSEIWAFVFLYMLTGYIKMYHYNNIMNIKRLYAGALAFLVWLLLSCGRFISSFYGWSIVQSYCETYRCCLDSIPCLVIAYGFFIFFLQTEMGYSKVINTFAKTSLGIYCFHQVPCFYNYWWRQILDVVMNVCRGRVYLCSVIIILVTYFMGYLLESLRTAFFDKTMHRWLRRWCDGIDTCIQR